MADLNKDLKEYLSRNEKSTNNNGMTRSFTTPNFMKNVSLPTTGFLSRSSSQATSDSGEQSNSWFGDSAETDPLLPSLSKKQRIVGFFLLLFMGVFCFGMSTLYIPFLVLKARKFAALFTLGSLFVLGSFSLLWGPVSHMKHICSAGRLPFTTMYFGSIFATLYFALQVQSTILTVLGAILQIVSLIWYIISYLPGGQTGFKFFTRIFTMSVSKTVQRTLPV